MATRRVGKKGFKTGWSCFTGTSQKSRTTTLSNSSNTVSHADSSYTCCCGSGGLDYSRLSIVIPVLNESSTNLSSLKSKLEDLGAEVIVVDDGSKRPFQEGIKHGMNFGYGAAILTGIKQANRPIILTMDGDGQHSIEDVRNLWQIWQTLQNGVGVDMLIGARRLRKETWIRSTGRTLLNILASILVFRWLRDLNSGMRLFRREIVIGYAPILCKTYSFTTSLTISMISDGYKVEWFPIKVQARKTGKSKVRLIKHGLVTLYYILRNGIALRTRRLRTRLRPLWFWRKK